MRKDTLWQVLRAKCESDKEAQLLFIILGFFSKFPFINLCCDPSLELSWQDSYNEGVIHIFSWRIDINCLVASKLGFNASPT